MPLLLPGALVVGFGFASGGFFARHVAVGVVVLCAVLAVSVVALRRPGAGFGAATVAVAGSLGLLGGWAFASEAWSDAPGRALFEFDRTLLYVLAFVTMAVLTRTARDVRWVVRGVLGGMFVIAGAGLVSRILPDVLPTEPDIVADRLSYPVTYWNTMGAIASCGFVLAFATTSDLRERAAVRIAAAAALPVFASTLLFTFSRASMLFGLVALVLFLVVGRSRGALGGVLVLPAAAVALTAAYNADALASDQPTTALAVSQGKDVALVLLVCMAGAALARLALLRLDAHAEAFTLPRSRVSPRSLRIGTGGAVLVAVAVALAAGGASSLSHQYDRFVRGDQITTRGADGTDFRTRLVNPGNNGRREQWRVAADAFAADRIKGQGAGTYVLSWYRGRENEFQIEDAHSLYVETAGELGLVGLLLLAGALGTILVGLLRRARGADRTLYGGLFAATGLWALLAGVDWHWEMPAATIWVFGAAGAALGAGARASTGVAPLAVRAALALGCLVLAITPVRVAGSEFASQASKSAFARGDCPTALQRARDSIDTLSVTPEPHEIAGYCHLRRGRPAAAVAQMQAAIANDPRNWRVHYGLALALGASGRDPRPEIARATQLNPLEPLAYLAREAFDATDDPQTWRRRALMARLPRD